MRGAQEGSSKRVSTSDNIIMDESGKMQCGLLYYYGYQIVTHLSNGHQRFGVGTLLGHTPVPISKLTAADARKEKRKRGGQIAREHILVPYRVL